MAALRRPLAVGLLFATVAASLQPPAVIARAHRSAQPICLAGKKATSKSKAARAKASGGGGFGASGAAKKTVAARPHQPNEEWRAFEDWLVEKGCTIDAIQLADCGGGLRGVRTTRAVKAGEEIIKIPRNLILDEMRVDAGEVGVLWQDHAERVPAYAQLALQVLFEARRGSRSPLAPYIAMLPTMEELDGYAPAASWSDEELDLAECEKLTADAVRLRSRRSGGGHPALEPTALASKWAEGGLPGVPPTADELAWAVTVVTSRAYGVEAPDGGMLSLLIPMVDMCNHNHPPHTAKGLEKEGDLFVIATEAVKVSKFSTASNTAARAVWVRGRGCADRHGTRRLRAARRARGRKPHGSRRRSPRLAT